MSALAAITVGALAFPALAQASSTAASARLTAATITVGHAPYAVAIDPSSHMAYVTNEDSDTVSVIKEATDTVVATIPVGVQPTGVAVDPSTGTVWVANYGDGTVSVISEATNQVIQTVNVDVNGANLGPSSVVVDAPTHTVFIGLYLGAVVAVNDQTYATVKPFYSTNGTSHLGVGAVNPATSTLYAPAADQRSVAEINTTTGSLITSLTGVGPVPAGVSLEDSSAAGYSGYLFVCQLAEDGHRIVVYNNMNTGVGEIWNVIHTSGKPITTAVDAATNTLYATLQATTGTGGSVAIISNANGKSPKTIETVPTGKSPIGIAIDPNEGPTGTTVFVANNGSDTVTTFAG
jgi:YVTN family beta-propeller protein